MPPELELDVRPRPVQSSPLRVKPDEEVVLELALDPRDLVRERAGDPRGEQLETAAPAVAGAGDVHVSGRSPRAAADVELDARILADYGDPPRSWLQAPMYAWRILRRRRELRAALVGRRAEAERASVELHDALVAFAERARPAAEKHSSYAAVLEDLSRAEGVLRSRDQVLAAEHDAHAARLSQVDARLAKLESELAQTEAEERVAVAELTAAQGALAREEAKLKRAEVELRAALQRETGGVPG
jgi:hypothetical protein